MKILWLKSELLHPVDKGGKIRTYQMLRHLKQRHEVTYLALTNTDESAEAIERAVEYCHRLVAVPWQAPQKFSARFYIDLALNLGSRLPYAIKKYRSTVFQQAIEREISGHGYDVVVCDFLVPSVNFRRGLNVPAVLFQHNVESVIWRRHFEVQTNPAKRLYLYNQWRKMRAYERETCQRFNAVVAVSEIDRDLMRDQYRLDHIYDVPTGVDTEYFRPQSTEPPRPLSLVFTGSMDWLPNEDAMRYFTEQIMPRVKRDLPGVTLTVVGRNPYPSLLELSERDPSVIVTGRVEDVRPFMRSAAAYIVPLRVGGGTRLKIYEAMAMEKPVISTSIGAEGLPVRDGVELLLADTSDSFADAIVRVLKESDFAREMGLRAAQMVREQFGWEKAADIFADICRRVVDRHREQLIENGRKGAPPIKLDGIGSTMPIDRDGRGSGGFTRV